MGKSEARDKSKSTAAGIRLPPALCKSEVWSKHTGQVNCMPSSQAREWSLSCLLDARPCGRFDTRELRDWIQVRLQRLQQRCSGQDKRQPALLKYAEQVVDVYNAAFQELTRQVASNCTDRGQLMADLWTSTNALLGRILMHLKTQTEGLKAMALALKRKDEVLEDACSRLERLVEAKTQEIEDLRRHVHTLNERLEIAENALLGNSKPGRNNSKT